MSREKPDLVLVLGGVASGKTTLRKDNYAKTHFSLDAGEIFNNLCNEKKLNSRLIMNSK